LLKNFKYKSLKIFNSNSVFSLYSSMYPMPRVVYSMASDALIFKWLAWIAPRLSTPTAACIFTGLLAGIFIKIKLDLNE